MARSNENNGSYRSYLEAVEDQRDDKNWEWEPRSETRANALQGGLVCVAIIATLVVLLVMLG